MALGRYGEEASGDSPMEDGVVASGAASEA